MFSSDLFQQEFVNSASEGLINVTMHIWQSDVLQIPKRTKKKNFFPYQIEEVSPHLPKHPWESGP